MRKIPILVPAPTVRPHCLNCNKPLGVVFRRKTNVELLATICQASVPLEDRPGLTRRCDQVGMMTDGNSVCSLGHVSQPVHRHTDIGKEFSHFGRGRGNFFCTDNCAVAFGEAAARSGYRRHATPGVRTVA